MSRFFIRRPIVAIVIAILFVVGGAVMVFRLPVAQFPEIAPPQIETTAMYTGADALTVEQSVATPIDAQVNGGGGVLFHEACGHGLEKDLVDKGASVFKDRLGEQVASSMVTLVDDGTMASRRSITLKKSRIPVRS